MTEIQRQQVVTVSHEGITLKHYDDRPVPFSLTIDGDRPIPVDAERLGALEEVINIMHKELDEHHGT